MGQTTYASFNLVTERLRRVERTKRGQCGKQIS